jgi:hypothetical protein
VKSLIIIILKMIFLRQYITILVCDFYFIFSNGRREEMWGGPFNFFSFQMIFGLKIQTKKWNLK